MTEDSPKEPEAEPTEEVVDEPDRSPVEDEVDEDTPVGETPVETEYSDISDEEGSDTSNGVLGGDPEAADLPKFRLNDSDRDAAIQSYALKAEPADPTYESLSGYADALLQALQTHRLVVMATPLFALELAQACLHSHLGELDLHRADTGRDKVAFPKSLSLALDDHGAALSGQIIFVPLTQRQFATNPNTSKGLLEIKTLAEKFDLRVLVTIDRQSAFSLAPNVVSADVAGTVRVDWIAAYLSQFGEGGRISSQAIHQAASELRRAAGDEATQELRIADDLLTFSKEYGSSGNTITDNEFLTRMVNIARQDKAARDATFVAKLNEGWDASLVRLLMTFMALSADDRHGPRIETIFRLGSEVLKNETLQKPRLTHVETREGTDGNHIITKSEPESVAAVQVWSDQFDALMHRCNIEVHEDHGPNSEEDGVPERSQILRFQMLQGRSVPDMLRRLYPKSLIETGNAILKVYPTCSDSWMDGGSMVRTLSEMLFAVAQIHPTGFRFEHLWSATLTGLEEQEIAKQSSSILQIMYRAFPATRLLYMYWKHESDHGRGDELLETARRIMVDHIRLRKDFSVCQTGIFALLYLCIEPEYPTADMSSTFLKLIAGGGSKRNVFIEALQRLSDTKENGSDASVAIKLTRNVLYYAMRDDIEVRERLVLDHYAHRQEAGDTRYFLELMYVRLTYDAIKLDFTRGETSGSKLLGARVFSALSEGETSEMVKALWSAKIDLLQITTQGQQQNHFLGDAARILCSSFEAYARAEHTPPSQEEVQGLLLKALSRDLVDRVNRSDAKIRSAWQDETSSAPLQAIIDTLEGNPRDEVADIYFSTASFVRSLAVSRWPFLALGDDIADDDIEEARAHIEAFPGHLARHLSRHDCSLLRQHWRTARKILFDSLPLANDVFSSQPKRACYRGWVEEKRAEFQMLIEGLSEISYGSEVISKEI
ncbi:hypothetical protein [uncultured Roseobacter sp.]|uniref:hypothetical protein n=1 Tax=uncultured Roseobacter sp. TaxID=114847 RepID=UPI002628A5B1|nr:hypothetical protein [uncultured Roseobacter sp.]